MLSTAVWVLDFWFGNWKKKIQLITVIPLVKLFCHIFYWVMSFFAKWDKLQTINNKCVDVARASVTVVSTKAYKKSNYIDISDRIIHALLTQCYYNTAY